MGIALLTAAFAVGAPLLLMLAQGDLAARLAVIERSATLLVRDGTPYLPAHQLSSWLAYDPYLPAMALFGLPSASGLQGAPGDPRVWLVLVTVAALAAGLRVLLPHSVRRCADCRRDLLRATAFAVACPVLALNLAVTTTDPPVLALMLLALSLISYPERVVPAAAALGLACAMKPTAWLAISVLAAMVRSRDGTRPAVVFTGMALAFVTAATLPAVIASPVAMVQNTVLFPLDLARHLSPAASLTLGDLLARLGPASHTIAVALLLIAGSPWPSRSSSGRPATCRGDVAAGDRPGPDVRPRPGRALRLLHLPAGPGRLAAADPPPARSRFRYRRSAVPGQGRTAAATRC